MLSLTSRGLRLSLGILLVLGAFALAPSTAHAQWSGPVCMDPAAIPALFTGSFTGNDHCEGLCKESAAYCKRFVRDAAECEQRSNVGSWFFVNQTECDTQPTPADKRDCRQSVNDARKSGRQSIRSSADDAVMNCETYKTDCIAACAGPT
jgi:hypothetical protein